MELRFWAVVVKAMASYSHIKNLTKRKSSSAPLKRNITGRGGTQLVSTITRAISSIDATIQKKRQFIQTNLQYKGDGI